MRYFVCFAVLAVVASMSFASPIAEDHPAQAGAEAYLDVDGQGHENFGDRQARQFGYPGFGGGFGGYRGGYGGGYGGYRGGYGGYRGGYGGGGYGGGYGGYRGGYGGYRGGFYG